MPFGAAEGAAPLRREADGPLARIAEAVCIVGPDGHHRHVNAPAAEIFRRLRARAEGRAVDEVLWDGVDGDGAPVPNDRLPSEITRLTGVECTDVELGFPDEQGELMWLRISTRRLSDGEPPFGVVASFADVTESRRMAAELKRAEEALARSEEGFRRATEQFSSAFAHAPIGMCLVSTDGRFLRVNRSLCELVGYPEDHLLTLTFQDITHPDDLDADLALVQDVLTGARTSYTMEKRYIHADGREIWILLAVSLVHDDSGAPLHFISQIQDITERRQLEARLREQAERDPLTGLFNRRRFDEEMSRQIIRTARTGEPAMLAVIDLDHFKRVNDVEGHLAGDHLLRAVGAALSGRLRLTDILVRMGGDEFAAILVGADEQGGGATARMLVEAVREVSGEGRAVTASIGLARIEADDDPASVLARADAAMYAAKAAGRGVVRLGSEPD